MDKIIEKMARDRIAARKADDEKRQQELEKITTERDEKQELATAAEEIMSEQLAECHKELRKLDARIATLQPQTNNTTSTPALAAVDTTKTSAPALPTAAQQSVTASQPLADSDDPLANVAVRYDNRLNNGPLTWLERRRFAKGLAQAERLTTTEVLAEFDKVDRERARIVNDPEIVSIAVDQQAAKPDVHPGWKKALGSTWAVVQKLNQPPARSH